MSFLKQFVGQHPRLMAWLVLAIGMVAILIWSARDVGLLPGQWAALVVATIGLAGLCVWIIGWEDDGQHSEAGEDQVRPQDEGDEYVPRIRKEETGREEAGNRQVQQE